MTEGRVRVIALTDIHRTVEPGKPGDKSKGINPVAPKTQHIKSGTIFMTKDSDEYADLIKSGAIRRPREDDKIAVPVEQVALEDDDDEETEGKTKAKAPAKKAKEAGKDELV